MLSEKQYDYLEPAATDELLKGLHDEGMKFIKSQKEAVNILSKNMIKHLKHLSPFLPVTLGSASDDELCSQLLISGLKWGFDTIPQEDSFHLMHLLLCLQNSQYPCPYCGTLIGVKDEPSL